MKRSIPTVLSLLLLLPAGAMADGSTPSVTKEPKPLPRLIEDLGSTDWQVRRDAAAELGERGPDHLGAVIPLLKSKDASARSGACEAIGAMTRRMTGRSREDAEKKLAAVRPAIGPMLDILESDTDDWTRTVATETLGGLTSQANAVAGDELKRIVLKILLDDNEDAWVRRGVYKIFNARELPKDDLKTKTVVEIHLAASRFMDIMFRGGSMQALARMGADAADAVPTMIAYAEEFHRTGKDNRKGVYAIRALGAIGAPAKGGLPILRKLAKEGPQGVAAKFNPPGSGEGIKKEAAGAIELIETALKESGKSNN